MAPKNKKPKDDGALPSKEEVLSFIHDSSTPVGKREIARHFKVRGDQRRELKEMLSELEDEGAIDRNAKKRMSAPGVLPEVTVIEAYDVDPDGELLGRPANWKEEDGQAPAIYIAPARKEMPAVARGDRVLANIRRMPDGTYEARPIRVLGGMPRQIVGVYKVDADGKGWLHPTDKRVKDDFILRKEEAGEAQPGELVLVEVKPHHKRLGRRMREVQVIERIGPMDDPRAISMIAIAEHDIPTGFSDEAVREAETAGPASEKNREDLRELPLVTIDGADARDFDDAVLARPDESGKNPGGWQLVVAIADVAHYVRPDSALDRNAKNRGNSVYFPDRVVPMLPEALSNGWCSLRPDEDRGCLAAFITIDKQGEIRKHRFTRAIMRSSARLTYEQVQQARDGAPDDQTKPLVKDVIQPLYGAFDALMNARARRGTLEIDVPERKVVINDEGKVVNIEPRTRLDSHRIIEEFMITANVAAAETLERADQPCMYRVHDAPDPDKVEALREVLKTFDIKLPQGVVKPVNFTRVLSRVEDTAAATMVNQLILRSQSQAVYSPDNIGHFGLALRRYAHFTSPIRRYADLLVHRAIIRGLGLGRDGLTEEEAQAFEEIGEHISTTERRAATAERDAVDRFTAAYLRDKVGTNVGGRINGVTRFGLFVTLDGTGADGLVPISTLPNDFYDHVEIQHALVGRRWGRVYRLGDRVTVRIVESDPMTGGIVLDLESVDESLEEGRAAARAAAPRGPGSGKRRAAARKAGSRKGKAKGSPEKQGKSKGKRRGQRRKGG